MGLTTIEETILTRLFDLEKRVVEMEQREITHEHESDVLRIRLESLETGSNKTALEPTNPPRLIPRLTKKVPTT